MKTPYDKLARDPRILDADVSDLADSLAYAPPRPPPALALIDALNEVGAIVPRTAEVVAAIESIIDEAGDQAAATALRIILNRLPKTKHGVELRLALLGASATEADAMQAGIARQSLDKNAERIGKRLRTSG